MAARRRIAIAGVLALLAAGAWWLVRAPAASTAPGRVARPLVGDAGMSLPKEPASRDAAVAKSPAASRPVAAATASSRCGVDQRPIPLPAGVDNDDVAASASASASAPRAAGPAYLGEQARIDAALRASRDPFDVAAADWLNIGDRLGPSQRLQVLVRRALGSNDARIYALAYRSCHDPYRKAHVDDCDLLSATRWSELDPGNGVPWMYVLSQAEDANDGSARAQALARLASASRFEDGMNAVPGAIVRQASANDDELAADLDLAEHAFYDAVAMNESFNALAGLCKDKASGDASRAQQCAAVGTLMFDHGDNLLLQAMGSVMVLRATGDPTLRDRGRDERQAMKKVTSPAPGQSDCATVRNGLQAMRRGAEVGELEAVRERLRNAGGG